MVKYGWTIRRTSNQGIIIWMTTFKTKKKSLIWYFINNI